MKTFFFVDARVRITWLIWFAARFQPDSAWVALILAKSVLCGRLHHVAVNPGERVVQPASPASSWTAPAGPGKLIVALAS